VSAAVVWLVHVDAVTIVEIMAGSILLADNYELCYISNMILWPDILTNQRSNVTKYWSDPNIPAATCNYHS